MTAMTAFAPGSSPLTRGKPQATRVARLPGRLIPAHAGKTMAAVFARSHKPAHPRSRGENASVAKGLDILSGSSPLTRGKPAPSLSGGAGGRLIPAHAGKTLVEVEETKDSPAHPRSRGENAFGVSIVNPPSGSSPLTRGKLRDLLVDQAKFRLIPAHAGKTLPDLRFYCADRSDLGNP